MDFWEPVVWGAQQHHQHQLGIHHLVALAPSPRCHTYEIWNSMRGHAFCEHMNKMNGAILEMLLSDGRKP
eukprot:scaffold42521_cov24-Tisochrysis_lutea.AAC.1